MQTYDIGDVTVILQRDNFLTPMNMNFNFSVDINYIVPENKEESEKYHQAISKAVMFLQGLNNSIVVETTSHFNEPIVTSQIGNISLEVPTGCNTPPVFGLIIYRKLNALMGENFPIEKMEVKFDLVDSSNGKLQSTMYYNAFMNSETTKLISLLDSYENDWEESLNDEADEEISEEIKNNGRIKPWWRRDDGNVRDFVDVSEETLESGNIRILTIDIGTEQESLGEHYSNNSDDDDDNTNPNNDGYINF